MPARWRRGAAALLAAGALLGFTTQHAVAAAGPEPRQFADGVYVSVGAVEDWGPANAGQVSNAGFVVGERCVAVIDTSGSPAAGAALREAVRRSTPLPVCYVINTHAHPDHVLGNQAFAAAGGAETPQFVGHQRLAAALGARGPFYLNALQRDFGADGGGARIVAPNLPVAAQLELDLGGRRLLLRAWPTAHTDADLTVLDERSGTLFLGDLLFVEHVPVLDGKLKGWLEVLAQLRALPVRLAVPGHGAPSADWPAVLDAQQRYLLRLQTDVRAAIRDGLTLAQAVERIAPDTPQWRLLPSFHRRNVTAAYAELEWE